MKNQNFSIGILKLPISELSMRTLGSDHQIVFDLAEYIFNAKRSPMVKDNPYMLAGIDLLAQSITALIDDELDLVADTDCDIKALVILTVTKK